MVRHQELHVGTDLSFPTVCAGWTCASRRPLSYAQRAMLTGDASHNVVLCNVGHSMPEESNVASNSPSLTTLS